MRCAKGDHYATAGWPCFEIGDGGFLALKASGVGSAHLLQEGN